MNNELSPERMNVLKVPSGGLGAYDVAIVGGGLAGLALSIQSATAGYRTILFEKEKYPFHKVCGEYISLESWDFLEDLGVPLSQMDLPIIKRLLVTAPSGKEIEQDLPLGGVGVSRYMLDALMAKIAIRAGVELMEATKVENIEFDCDLFNVHCSSFSAQSKVAAGTFGKRSNLDIKWKRPFILQKQGKLNNYIGIKYHIKTDWPHDLIALHNFRNGYCGISQIENEKFCLCYLTTAKNLEKSENSIPDMENNILCANPHLKKVFRESQILSEAPVTISQISFSKKDQVHNHVLMIGDAAGMITPLCGNGMSMALHGSKIAFEQIHLFLQNKIPRQRMEQAYTYQWQKQFGKRLRTGRMIQQFFGGPILSNVFISSLKPFPALIDKLITQTHGQPF
jgi:flavin-dependent dehydrogenase